ncbi:hypothetical protein ABPG75_012497 [Micractinium tetrahymenae]
MLASQALAGAAPAAGPCRRTSTRRQARGIITAASARRPAAQAAAASTSAPPAPTAPEQGAALQPATPPAESRDLEYNGFRSTRRTKLIATIGPACDDEATLEALSVGGMNVARLNLAHGTHEYHRSVVQCIRKLNKEKGFSVAIMMDTEGSEVHISDLPGPIKAEKGQEFTFTVRGASQCAGNCFSVSYEAFAEDTQPGDMLVVDGGMVSLEVVSKEGPDVVARVVDPGLILSRANLVFRRAGRTVRARNSHLPVISAKDWRDVDMAIETGVDFISLSFVKSADPIRNLKSYIESRASRRIEVIAKIESSDALPNVAEIVAAADGVMVARGDLGAQVPFENVPSIQKEVVMRCRQAGKPVIVAAHLLQSMHTLPTPTRAEVSDIADCVRQQADALMLCGETAAGAYPLKSLEVLRCVATRIEDWMRQEKHGQISLPPIGDGQDGRVSEELCAAAAMTADALGARAVLCFTRRGYMPGYLSRCRPDAPIFAFTDKQETRQMLNLRWGVSPFRMDFSADSAEDSIRRAFKLLRARNLVSPGDLVVVVSDVRTELDGVADTVRSVQVRHAT